MFKRIFATILAFFMMLFGISNRPAPEPDPEAVYQKISAEEAYCLMQDNDDYILLDVRTEAEYAEKHIEGAILIPNTELAGRAAEELPDKKP